MFERLKCIFGMHEWRAAACAPCSMEKATLVERECIRCGIKDQPQYCSNAYARRLGCPEEQVYEEDAGKWVRGSG